MKENLELEGRDVRIDRDLEVDEDTEREITAYVETWFDVDKKFGLRINDEDGTWLNIYAKYNPYEDTLRIECEISREAGGSSYFDYSPTENESRLLKELIAQTIRAEYNQTPQEFCETYGMEDQTEKQSIGGME